MTSILGGYILQSRKALVLILGISLRLLAHRSHAIALSEVGAFAEIDAFGAKTQGI